MNDNANSKKVNDHLANERTFLSWIRTSLGIMGFGFVVVKFSLFVKQITMMINPEIALSNSHGYSSIVGVAIVVIGSLTAILACFKYHKRGREIEEDTYSPSASVISTIAVLIFSVGFILSLYLIDSF